MSNIRFAVIDLDCNKPLAAFDSIDDANECVTELTAVDINCMIDTIDDSNGYRL